MSDFLLIQLLREETTPTAVLYSKLIGALIGLARATEGAEHMLSNSTGAAVLASLQAIHRGISDEAALDAMTCRVTEEKRKLVPSCFICACPCGRTMDYDIRRLSNADDKIRMLKASLFSRICRVSAAAQDSEDEAVHKFLYLALFAIGMDDWGEEELLPILQEAETMDGPCM